VCAVFSALAFCRASSFALHSWSVMCEGSGMWEIPLSSSWWCSSWSVSVGTFFLDLFCGGIVSCFSAEPRWVPMLGVRKIGGNPRTPEHKNNEIQRAIRERQRDKESPKDCSRLKSCEPFYTCPCAPFYKETKGFFTFRDYPRI
jgi:hypothetical protein